MTTSNISSTFGRPAPGSDSADDAASASPVAPAMGPGASSLQTQGQPTPSGPHPRHGRIGKGAVVGAVLTLGVGLVAKKLISDLLHEPQRHRMSSRQHEWWGCPADHLWIRHERDRKDTSPLPSDATYKKTASMMQHYVGEDEGRYFGINTRYLSKAVPRSH
jgi:hypothetical protein